MDNEPIRNAVSLTQDEEFRSWVIVGLLFTAKEILGEDPDTDGYALRRRLAEHIILEPDEMNIVRRMQNVLAVDLEVNAHNGVDGIGQGLLLEKIKEYWTPLAALVYPESE